LDEIDEQALSALRSIEGVVHADIVPEPLRETLLEVEERYASLGPIPIDNVGVRTAVAKERLFVIIKDGRFRPPPIATVILTDDSGEIIGEEIIPGRSAADTEGEQVVHLGKDFVIYSSRAKGRGKSSKFAMPPVPFSEIEQLGFAKNVVSASPSTLGDMELKKALGIEDDPKVASILIGFDL